MRYLLTSQGRRALQDCTREYPLLGFDFDGTLAPIVDEPDHATLPTHTWTLLQQVATRFACVVLSGRARQDVMQRLGALPLCEVFGNHGLEPWHTTPAELQQLAVWQQQLVPLLMTQPGVWIEDKRFSLSIHYRQCADQPRAAREIAAALSQLPDARIIAGKCVYNVMPNRTIHKGTVFQEAMYRYGCPRALYIGDDHTDEDVFTSCDPAQVLGIRVGKSPDSRAAYYLQAQEELDDFLKLLLHS